MKPLFVLAYLIAGGDVLFKAAKNIVFDGDSEVVFEVGDYTYSINYFSYSKYYTLSIEGPNDFYEYYSSSSSNGGLTVK